MVETSQQHEKQSRQTCCYSNLTFSDVQIEKVAIQYRLHTASHDGNQVKETLKVEAVDPVDDVESSVSTKGKEIMAGDGLCLAGLADHEELW